MIIAKAQIAMAASHDYREEHQVSEKLDFWLTPKQTTETTTEIASKPRWDEQVSISASGLSLLQRSRQTLNLNTQMDARSRVNLMILQRLYETITGRSMNLIEPSELAANGQAPTLTVDGAPSQAPAAPAADSAGFGMVYQRHERYQEQEKMEIGRAHV